MLIDFFYHLKSRNIKTSTREYLTLLEAMQAQFDHSMKFDDLSRTCLVKDEAAYDRFDQAFAEYFRGVERIPGLDADIPEKWPRLMAKKHLSDEEKAKLGSWAWTS